MGEDVIFVADCGDERIVEFMLSAGKEEFLASVSIGFLKFPVPGDYPKNGDGNRECDHESCEHIDVHGLNDISGEVGFLDLLGHLR